jgi:hypothetical protein
MIPAYTVLTGADLAEPGQRRHKMASFDNDLTGYEEHLRDQGTREDYMREAYGDPCPCGTLRWGADCPKCYNFEAEEREALAHPDYARYAPAPADPYIAPADSDDIPF